MRRFTSISAVVFDLGGTLLDFAHPESLSTLRAGFRSGYDHLRARQLDLPSFGSYRRGLEWRFAGAFVRAWLRGRELDPLVHLRRAHRRYGLSGSEITELATAIYAPTKTIARAAEGAVDTLQTLKNRGYRLAAISNTVAPPSGLDDHLAAEGLLPFFPLRVYSCVFGVPKPNPRIFEETLHRLALPAEETAYVGDKPRIDVKGARQVGMATVLRVAPDAEVPPGPRADLVIRSIPELLDHFPPRNPS